MKINAVSLSKTTYLPIFNENRKNAALGKDVFVRNTPQVPAFGALPELPSPFLEDADEINEIINGYHYGKVDLVDNTPENFAVRTTPEKLIISGYRNPDPDSKYGTCEELAYKAGREIQEKFGDKYITMVVRGKCPKEGMTHFYLALYENNDKNRARMQEFQRKEDEVVIAKGTILDATEKMSEASKNMYSAVKLIFGRYGQNSPIGKATLGVILIMQSGGTPKKELKNLKDLYEKNNALEDYELLESRVKAIQDIQAGVAKAQNDISNSARVSPSDFEGALLADPSYKAVRMYPRGMLYKEYPQEQIISLEEHNPFKDKDYVIPTSIISSNRERQIGFAFGSVDDLAPELIEKLKGKLNGETTLCLNFKLTGTESSKAFLSYTPLNSRNPETLSTERLLGEDHKLVKFLNRANGK